MIRSSQCAKSLLVLALAAAGFAVQAADKVTVQLKWVPQAQFAGYYMAAAKGFYKDAGLDVTIKPGGPDIAPTQVIAGKQADIVVDMLTFGWFGANIREGMMLGKPCVCFLRPEWLQSMRKEIPAYVDELPVISATPDTVEYVLRDLIRNPDKRKEIGQRSRAFALKWHSSAAGAKRFMEIYSALLRKV